MAYCGACGSSGARPFSLRREGEVVATGHTCDRCLMDVMAELQELDRQLHELVEAGVPESEAQRIMYARAEGDPNHVS